MKFFFSSLFGAIIGTIVGSILLVFIAVGAIGAVAASVAKQKDEVPDKAIVLTLDLRETVKDQPPADPFQALVGDQVGFIDIVLRLHAAADDNRVKGVFIRASESGIGSARAEELRDAFKALKAAGKFIIAHTQGSYGGGPSGYRALALADEIWIQPGSDVIAGGVAFETMFLKDMLDKIAVTPEFEAFYEFKNAVNVFEESDYTDAHRLAETRIAQSIWERSLSDIAVDRDLTTEQVRAALESSPISTTQMIDLSLADAEGWPLDARKSALDKAGKGAHMLAISDYASPPPPAGAPAIAIVGGEGGIVTGYSDEQFFPSNSSTRFASDTIANALLKAAKNKDTKAIVFRVESPGGSATASDQIWHAVETIREDYEKPVIVSMGSVAASGGYYVSAGADWIVAKPSTITGSIGVFGGKFAIKQGLARIGINAEGISVGGPFAGAFTSTDSFTDAQRALLRSFLKRVYDRFVSLVAEGRDMTVEEADEIARGRVWSGEDAFEIGLVDELGGLQAAINKAKEMSGIKDDEKIRLLHYPKSDWPFALGNLPIPASEIRTLGQLSDLLDDPRMQALITEISAAQTLSGPEARAYPMVEQ